jgi:hypothetical protein
MTVWSIILIIAAVIAGVALISFSAILSKFADGKEALMAGGPVVSLSRR